MGLPDRSPISYAVIIQTEVAITPLSGVKLAAETNLSTASIIYPSFSL